MAIVDDQGRLFGRFNLVDALVAVFAIGLIPLLYGAAMLFWQPQPVLTAVEPASLTVGPNMRFRVRGEHLRPYMRVSIGTHQGRDFLFRSTEEAEVNLPEIPPGVYDVVLYDIAQERSRLSQVLTIEPPPVPSTSVILTGHFGNVDAANAGKLQAGVVVTGIGTVRRVAEPVPGRVRITQNPLTMEVPVERAVIVPAELNVPCEMRVLGGMTYCQVAGQTLVPTVVLIGQSPAGDVSFQIDQVRGFPELTTLAVEVRFAGPPSIINEIRPGDLDRGLYPNPLSAGARVLSVRRSSSSEADVTLEVQGERGSHSWIYQMLPLRAGSAFALRSNRYELSGTVQRVTPAWTPGS